MKRGLLTESQYRVLTFRGRGLTQREISLELGTTRANVSMIESRARRRVELAEETLEAYRSTLTDHVLKVPKGTRFYEIPSTVLREADRWGVHLKSNIVEIVRMVQSVNPPCLERGKTTRGLSFVFDQGGRLRLSGRERRRPSSRRG